MTSKQISFSVSGNGVLLGPVISKTFEQFPQATIYDRTQQFRNAVGHEQQVSKYMNEADRARVGRAVKNLNQPDDSDLKIIVHKAGNREIVEVIGSNGSSKHSFDFSNANEQKLKMFLQEIMRLIRLMHGPSKMLNQA